MHTKHTVRKLPHSRVEIDCSIPWSEVAPLREAALLHMRTRVVIDGFRDGTAPLELVAKHVGDRQVLEAMAEHAIAEAYPKLLTDEKIEAIGRPTITLKKLAPENDVEFSIATDVIPTVALGDYKALARRMFETPIAVSVSDGDVDQMLKEIRQMRAHQKMHEDKVDHESHDHRDIPDEKLPPLDDAFAKSIGAFESLAALKNKIRENLHQDRTRAEHDRRRGELLEALVKESTIDIPALLVDSELDKMIAQFSHDIALSGRTMDEYLHQAKKTLEDLKNEWRAQAEQRAKIQLALDHISEAERIVPTDEEIKNESDKIMEMYKDQKDIAPDRVRAYVTQILTNSKVLEFLEGQK